MEKWKLPIILPTSRQKLWISLASHYCVFQSLFQLPRNHNDKLQNLNVQADYFLPIISDCTLIASKKSKRPLKPFAHTDILLLLVILVQTYHISTRSVVNVQCASSMVLAAILKNQKIMISPQQIDWFWQNLAWRCLSALWTWSANTAANTTTTTILWLSGFCPGLSGLAGTRKVKPGR